MRTIRERSVTMVPFCAARLEDLGPGNLLEIECAYRRVDRLTAAILATAGARADDKLGDLAQRLRCRECDERGKWRCRSERRSRSVRSSETVR